MIRSALLVVIAVVVTAFMSTCAFLFPLISPGENKVHKIANLWARMLLWLTSTRVDVIGKENVLMEKPQIFMANHQSDFDILIVLAHIPGQFRWIAKKELFKIPIFGKAMRNAGYIEIDRQNHEKALKSLDEAAQKIREGKSVVTFPEGTRSRDGKIRPFKQGMFHLAIQAGVPIVPISIIGAHEIMPKRTLKVKPGRITMVIDRPVDVSGYTLETRGELIEKIRHIIVRNFESPAGPHTDASEKLEERVRVNRTDEMRRNSFQRRAAEIAGVCCLAFAIFLLLALFSYHPLDPSFTHYDPDAQLRNLTGSVGSYTADTLIKLMGISIFWLPVMLLVAALRYLREPQFRIGSDDDRRADRSRLRHLRPLCPAHRRYRDLRRLSTRRRTAGNGHGESTQRLPAPGRVH